MTDVVAHIPWYLDYALIFWLSLQTAVSAASAKMLVGYKNSRTVAGYVVDALIHAALLFCYLSLTGRFS